MSNRYPLVGSNYSKFEEDGTLVAVGNSTTWRDETRDALSLLKTGPGVSLNTTEATVDFITTANTADYIYSNFQLNHDRLLTANIAPHIHWFQAQNTIPNWLLQYRWQKNDGSAKVTAWTNYKCNTNVFTYASGTIHQISKGVGITPPGESAVSDIVQFRVIRDSTNTSTLFAGADPYTATASIISFDVHIQTDTLGSRTEFAK
jgi:hypothetical protein